MKNIFKSVLIYLLTPTVSLATTITFDNLSAGTIPVGYGGLQWTGLVVANGTSALYGTHNGVVSANNVAIDIDGRPGFLTNSTAFNLNSAYLTAVYNDGLSLEVKGFVGTVLAYDQTFTLNATVPTLLNFNYMGVTGVEFLSSGGTAHPGYPTIVGHNENFVMDNMTTSTPDSGATAALLGLALGAMAVLKKAQSEHSKALLL